MNQSNIKNRSRSKSRPVVDEEPNEQPVPQEPPVRPKTPPPEVKPSVEKPKQCYRHPFWNFLRDFREELKLKGTKILAKEVSKQAGQRWRTMTVDERTPYIQEATATRMADGNRVIRRKPYRTANNARKCPGCGTRRQNKMKGRKRSYSTDDSDSTESSATTSKSESLSDDTGDEDSEETTVSSISSESSESSS